jgi:hypothetical protein
MTKVYQRKKIYKIEDLMSADNTTPEGMQAWFDWVVKRKWWMAMSDVAHVRCVFPVVGKMSGAFKEADNWARIEFGVFSLCRQTACHELAHILMWRPRGDVECDHDEQFAGMYLFVVKKLIGAESAKELARKFKEKGVKWIPVVE